MKRFLTLLLMAVLLTAACSRGRETAPALPSEAGGNGSSAGEKPSAPPAEPLRTEGPLYLLAPPVRPLWPGPLAVVVENAPDARPQAGLAEADLVIELLAEAEVTRFIALYWSSPAQKIGPVRSARQGIVAVAGAYGAPLVHAGASNEALAMLQSTWGARDIDEIYGGGAFFYRSKDREPPHNLYTRSDLLERAVTTRKLELKAAATTPRAAAPPEPGQEATQADVEWHRLHHVAWELKGERYHRLEDGTPHTLEDGRPIQAANLIFLEVSGKNRGVELGWTLDFSAGGKATVLSVGHRWEGTWSLEEGGGFRLAPSGGKVPLLAPGPTWVHLITHESAFAVRGKTP